MAAASERQDESNSHLGLLYRLYRTALLRFLTRRVGHDDAPDLLQEAFIRMARAKTDPHSVRNDKAFLFQVASNLAADHGRESRRRSRLLTGDEIDAILDIPDETARPADAAQARLEGQSLARALAEMPPRRADAFRLSRLEGLSHQAIAARLGVSVRTVEAEIRMALDHCAERLGRTQPGR
ncbi:RNA polymerase sigma factor [Methylobacterium sp. B4]|uniref:RNA polymerase sigma factor n=1 Tax=Methylobacterium sp. B4 TaxID=1938755 RepID=UPI000D7736E5|nr:RNA polymerase sigma factor [Methylobacterium sp. B4]PXW62117.1 RNA polymerase sigma-70 factor (ECF subfamily) [Methylobacterium sp. B4]